MMTPDEMDEFVAGALHPKPQSLCNAITERPNSVFFYPAGLYDGRPLRYFSSLCDTFIYCDVAFRPDELVGGLQPMMADAGAELHLPLNVEEVAVVGELGLGIDERPDWLLRYIAPQYQDQYAEAMTIVQQHGGPSGRKFECVIAGRTITVYCFCAEACHCYAALFSRNNVAPRAVCLKRPVQGHRRFLDMDNWDAPLGRAVADSPQPELVVRGAVREDNWPWNEQWQQFDNGQIVAYGRQHEVMRSVRMEGQQ